MTTPRERFVAATRTLMTERGYAATGLADIVAAGGGARGSLYHFFPGGKEELAAEAVSLGGRAMTVAIKTAFEQATTAAEGVRGLAEMLAWQLEGSDFRQGCPVATVTLERAAESNLIQEAAAMCFRTWLERIAARLVGEGRDRDEAQRLATLVVAGLEGALIMARGLRDTTPIVAVGNQLAALIGEEKA